MKKALVFQDFYFLGLSLFFISLLLLVHFFVFSQTWTHKGIDFFKKKEALLALDLFSKVLKEEPYNPYAHLNVALTHDLNKQPLKAIKAYKVISEFFKERASFFASFNLGELNSRLNNLDEALKFYQEALSYNEENLKVKQNIELLFLAQKSQKKSKDKSKQKQGDKKDSKDQSKQAGQSKDEKSGDKKDKGEGGEQKESEQTSSADKKGSESQKEDEKLSEKQAPKRLNKEQTEAILNAIEKEEAGLREKLFQKKQINRNVRGKDW